MDPEPDVPPVSATEAPPPREGFAKAILVITFVNALVMWATVRSPSMAMAGAAVMWGTVFITALLAFLDARQLTAWGAAHPITEKRPLMGAAGTAIGYILLWAIMLPVHFRRRRKFGARNYFALALVGVLSSVSGASMPFFLPYGLPAANAREVVQVVQKMTEQSLSKDPERFGKPTISNVVELSFDKERQIRDVKCTLTTKLGAEDSYYTVEWQDPEKRFFRVVTRAKP